MPIYEYKCKKCGTSFEELVLDGDEAEKCPSCSSSEIQKLMSSCGSFAKSAKGESKSSYASSAPSCAPSSFS